MKKITFKTILKNFEEIVASLLFCATLALVVLNVITRYVLKSGIPWSEEFATGCFVWTAFIGAAACYKRRQHLGVDMIVKRLPQKVQNVINIVVDILLAILCIYLFYIGCLYIMTSYTKPTALLGISSAVFSVSLPLAFLDMSVWSVVFIIRDLKCIKKYGRTLTQEEYIAMKEAEV